LNEAVDLLSYLPGKPLLRYDENSGVPLGNSPRSGPTLPGTVQKDKILAIVCDEHPILLCGHEQVLVILGTL
jgi:hypothetical protein